MNNLINIVDNSFDLIIIDKTYDNYDVLLETVYNKLKDKGTCWLLTNSLKIKEQIDSIKNTKFINHLENWCTITTENKTLNFYHLTKSDKYTFNSIEIKRDVVVPYTVKGEDGSRIKRGWDYEDGKPKRWTGISNSFYVSKPEYIYDVFSLLSSYEHDNVYSVFYDAVLIRDYSKLKGQFSTSEDCEINFSKRDFLPKC